MTPELILMMLAAVLAAVVLYTFIGFIGFIPGTDETSVLAPVTLAVVLAGAPPQVCSHSSSPRSSRSTL